MQNLAIGYSALLNTTISNNFAIGYSTLLNTTESNGTGNIAIGEGKYCDKETRILERLDEPDKKRLQYHTLNCESFVNYYNEIIIYRDGKWYTEYHHWYNGEQLSKIHYELIMREKIELLIKIKTISHLLLNDIVVHITNIVCAAY